MLEIIAMTVVVLFMIHMTVLLLRCVGKSQNDNQTIYLSGGKAVEENRGAGYQQLLADIDAQDATVVNGRNMVTSSFSYIYIRLYQLYTGKCYDSYLENTLQIGREGSMGNMPVLVLDDPMVSKKHCMLYRRGDNILIQDLESTNHTYVNGCKIQGAVPISHGDQLSLGRSQYQFQCYYQR